MADPALTLLLHVILPLWLVSGVADWLCHMGDVSHAATARKVTPLKQELLRGLRAGGAEVPIEARQASRRMGVRGGTALR